ncbi:hypothetical protein [Tabrizicola sp. TH137]|uniref:hypothetical protein n=1 Tax=Tabrizicola sp. TH137 TaxID=2067452 RepID=UPI0011815756|nr:hypothetical protein [Tabrizicola sp. TH137]
MRSLIVDEDAIAAVSPAAIAAFARSLGWEVQGRYRDFADIYSNKDMGAETLIPKSSRIVDYVSIVSTLLEVFSEQMGRDQEEVYHRLIDAENDVFRVRAIDAYDDGSIGVEAGISMIEQAKEALLAAACSISSPQPVYRAGANKEAMDFLKTVRLGQTRQGSYVVNLLSKVPPTLQHTLVEEWAPLADEPIERRVSRRLVDGLAALRGAAEEVGSGRGLETFEASVANGVSANLCEALARMIGSVNRIELSLEWAFTRPVPKKISRFNFGDDDAAIFREAARKLREKRPRPSVTLYGVVNKLARKQEDYDGTVSLKADIDGQLQSVTASLDQANYEAAVMAHRSKFPVVVNGDLERIGSRWHLTNANVKAIEATVDEDATDLDADF